MKPLVAFRVDGGAGFGSGHVRRCLTLADELARRGAACLFVCRCGPHSMAAEIAARGHRVAPMDDLPAASDGPGWQGIDERADAHETLRLLPQTPAPQAMVVDHYGLGAIWQQAVRARVNRIAVIDDLADRAHAADLLVDSAPGAERRYAGLLPEACRLLCGPAYALLGPRFRQVRSQSRVAPSPVGRVLISFGALDSAGHGRRALGVVRQVLGPDISVDLVAGGGSPSLGAVKAALKADPATRLHVDTDAMPELIAAAGLAIGAGGTTSWERACLGVPTIVCAIAENQRHVVTSLVEAGAAVEVPDGAGAFEQGLAAALQTIGGSVGLRGLMASAARDLVDGRGAGRVARAILGAGVGVRTALAGDRQMVWAWRNAERVRLSSLSTAAIAWEDHCRWFDAVLAGNATQLLIAEMAEGPVGVVRFDGREGAYLVSVYLAPEAMGLGIGADVLRAGEEWMRASGRQGQLRAEILTGNTGSAAAFANAGYRPRHATWVRSIGEGAGDAAT